MEPEAAVSAASLGESLPAGLVRCRGCRSIGYRYERYCVCCGIMMSDWRPAEQGCERCGAAIEHAVAHYCSQCGASVRSSIRRSGDDRFAEPARRID